MCICERQQFTYQNHFIMNAVQNCNPQNIHSPTDLYLHYIATGL